MNKKILMFAFAFVFSVLLIGNVSALTSISNCTELQDMNLDLTEDYQLTANIDCSDTVTWNSGKGFYPIGFYNGTGDYFFNGNFDGQGYNITNLYQNWTTETTVALFGLVGNLSNDIEFKDVNIINASINAGIYEAGILIADIVNAESYSIKVSNVTTSGNVSGGDWVAGLIAHSDTPNITIEDCSSSASVFATNTGTGNWVAGLVGDVNQYATIKNSHATGLVYSKGEFVGGLVGYAVDSNTVIINSYATGDVYIGNGGGGGLVGENDGLIDNCYATGNVYGEFVGGFVGYNIGTINNSYATGNITGFGSIVGDNIGGFADSNLGLIDNCYATGNVTGHDTVGGIADTNDGTGIINNSYFTGNLYGIAVFENPPANFGGIAGVNNGMIVNSYSTGKIMMGITDANRVGGVVGVMLSGGIIDNSYSTGNIIGYADTGGLVGQSLGDVTNSYATGNVTGDYNVGGLIGSLYDGNIITNSYATGNVNGNYNVGGLVGVTAGGFVYINNSYATGNVNGNLLGSGDEIGGLIGFNAVPNAEDVFILTNSYALGNVTGDVDVGGLIGFSDNGGDGYLEINECYAEGIVNGTGYVGGLIGTTFANENNILINNCHSIGNVYSTGTYTGGLIGYSQEYIVVANSYSESNVTGTENVGGLVGQIDASGNVTGCYAVGNVYGSGSEIAGLIGENYGIVRNSFAMGNVNGGVSSSSAGGLIGYSEGFISTCYATGDVTTVANNMGGLVGDMNGILENSYATGDISGEGAVGGLVGMSENNANITNCFAVGSATNTAGNTGGLIGRNEGNITNCYSAGEVNGTGENDGGLVGLDTSGDWGNLITGSYWNLQMSKQNSSAGGTGLTTAQMKSQSSFVDWDFGSVWEITAGYFPNLQFSLFLYPSSFSEQTVYVTADYTYQAIDSNLNDVVTGSVTGFKSATDFFPTFIVLGSLVVLVLITVIIINSIRSSGITNEGA